jgi:hypothetical protein
MKLVSHARLHLEINVQDKYLVGDRAVASFAETDSVAADAVVVEPVSASKFPRYQGN